MAFTIPDTPFVRHYTTGRMHPDRRDGGWVLVRDVQELIEATQALCSAVNSRGQLNPDGYDANTETAVAHQRCLRLIHQFNDEKG